MDFPREEGGREPRPHERQRGQTMRAPSVSSGVRIRRRRHQILPAARTAQLDRGRHGARPRVVGSKDLARALSKPHVRVVGVDDGPFRRTGRYAPLVAVVLSTPNYVEGILRGRVSVDGTDATERVATLLRSSPFLEGVRAVLLDGIAVGGFNLLNLETLHRELARPIVTVTRRSPDFSAIRRALQTYFPEDFTQRWRLVRARALFRVPTDGAPLWASAVGCSRSAAVALIRRTTVRGRFPEPLRLARLVARSIASWPRPARTLQRRAGASRRGRHSPPPPEAVRRVKRPPTHGRAGPVA